MDPDILNRLLLAMGLVEGDVPPSTIEHFFNEWGMVFPDNQCLQLHNTIASLYEWLIRNAARDASGGGSRDEKVGDMQLKVSNFNKGIDWKAAYDRYLENPDAALPACRGQLVANGATIIINGTNKDTVRNINRKRDRYNAYDERSPFTPRTRFRRNIGFRFDEDDYSYYYRNDCD